MRDDEKQRNYERAEKLISEQNFSAAVIAGAVATILAGIAYGLTVSLWPITYGFAAAGVGVIIGFVMGFLGRGIATKFAAVAALYTLAGCFASNVFRVVIDRARATGTSPIDVFENESFSALAAQAASSIFSIALIYWLVAVVAAVYLSRRALSRSDRLAIGLYSLRE